MSAPHPLKGRPVLVWIPMLMQGHQAFVEQQAQYHRKGMEYTVRRFFAQVIYRDQESLFGTPPGWVVSCSSVATTTTPSRPACRTRASRCCRGP